VPELTGCAVAAAEQTTMHDEPGPDTPSQGDGGNALQAARMAEEVLSHGKGVGVIVDPDRYRDNVGKHCRKRDIPPAKTLHLPAYAFLGVDLTGERQPDSNNARAIHPGSEKQPLRDARAYPDDGLRSAVMQRRARSSAITRVARSVTTPVTVSTETLRPMENLDS
jgi:hypothetical protein